METWHSHVPSSAAERETGGNVIHVWLGVYACVLIHMCMFINFNALLTIKGKLYYQEHHLSSSFSETM